jgi:4'-phosphopantetheinyl transferase
MPFLTSSDIHLSVIFCSEIADPALLARYRQLLSPDELEQQQRFRQPEDRHRYLLTRALLRTALSGYSSVPAAEWSFARDTFGRPHITNQHPDAAQISFNISHTREVILLGITQRVALGVDIEHLQERADGLQLAERYFSVHEAASVRALPESLQQGRFFEYWTLKEAYIKALGRGLSIPLSRFSFDRGDGGVSLTAEAEVDSDPGRWRFWLLRPRADHLAAVCVESEISAHQSLRLWKVIPLVGQEPLEYVELARSGAR